MSAIDRPATRPSSAVAPRGLGDLRRILLPAFVVLSLLGLVQVSQVGDATSTGYAIRRLEQQRQDWDAQVRQLEAEVAALTSLERVEREARDRLGLVPAGNSVYLNVSVPPPEQQLVPRRYVSSEVAGPPTQNSGGSWWQSLLKLLPFY